MVGVKAAKILVLMVSVAAMVAMVEASHTTRVLKSTLTSQADLLRLVAVKLIAVLSVAACLWPGTSSGTVCFAL